MAFYFVNDGVVDTAVSFQEDIEALWASAFIANNADLWTQGAGGSRPNVVSGAELLQPYSQQFVDPIEAQIYRAFQNNWAADEQPEWSSDETLAGITGSGNGSLTLDATATAAALVSGAASGMLSLDGSANASVIVSGIADGLLEFTGGASGTAPAQIILYRGDDAPDWRKRFYDKQLKEFEESLEEIAVADDQQDAAQEALEAFRQIETKAPEVKDSSQAIIEALRGLAMHAMRRKELQAELAQIRAETKAIAEYRRRRRNNEAAILLLM